MQANKVVTYIGLVVALAGLALIALAWGRTAGELSVGLQVPYVVSAGFGGLALVVIGVALVAVAGRCADAMERRRQTGELRELLTELRRTLGEEQ